MELFLLNFYVSMNSWNFPSSTNKQEEVVMEKEII